MIYQSIIVLTIVRWATINTPKTTTNQLKLSKRIVSIKKNRTLMLSKCGSIMMQSMTRCWNRRLRRETSRKMHIFSMITNTAEPKHYNKTTRMRNCQKMILENSKIKSHLLSKLFSSKRKNSLSFSLRMWERLMRKMKNIRSCEKNKKLQIKLWMRQSGLKINLIAKKCW